MAEVPVWLRKASSSVQNAFQTRGVRRLHSGGGGELIAKKVQVLFHWKNTGPHSCAAVQLVDRLRHPFGNGGPSSPISKSEA